MKPFSPHQQERDDVPKIHSPWLGLTFKATKAILQQIIIKSWLGLFRGGGHMPCPETERIQGRTLPGLDAKIFTHELMIFFQ